MFSFLMLLAFTSTSAIAQVPETTTTTTTVKKEKKESWWKRTFGKKKKKKKDTAKTYPQEKARKDVKTVKTVKKPKTSKDVKVEKPRKDVKVVKPTKDTVTKKKKKVEGPSKVNKPNKDIPNVSTKPTRVKKDKKKPSQGMESPSKPNKGKKVDNTKKIPDNSKGKVRKVEKKPSGSPHPDKMGKPQCGVKGCEHPGKHAGLHKHQNPVRPYVKTDKGYEEVNPDGTVDGKRVKKVKKIKNKN